MAAERYLSRRIPDLCVGNNIDEIDKKLIPASIHSNTKAETKALLNLPIPPVNNDTTTVAKFGLLRFL